MAKWPRPSWLYLSSSCMLAVSMAEKNCTLKKSSAEDGVWLFAGPPYRLDGFLTCGRFIGCRSRDVDKAKYRVAFLKLVKKATIARGAWTAPFTEANSSNAAKITSYWMMVSNQKTIVLKLKGSATDKLALLHSIFPPSLGTADGFFNKTNKAEMLHYLMEDAPGDVSYSKEAFYIQDGNALFHALMNLPPTFEGICLQSLDHMAAKKHFVFSTDSYNNDSVKAQERLRRGVSQRCIIGGPATRKPSDFKLFLENDETKTQLCKLLLEGGAAKPLHHSWRNVEQKC
ncbi:unnamed protein product [Boreogadus saida]